MVQTAVRRPSAARTGRAGAGGAATIVLHGGWVPGDDPDDGAFAVWGEAPRAPRRHLRPLAGSTLPRHPFAARAPDLFPAFEADRLGSSGYAVRLPTVAGKPLASPAARVEPPEQPAPPELTAWHVDAVRLLVPASIEWLIGLGSPLPAGFALGDDLRYWSAAARFALELLARQRVRPTLARAAVLSRGETTGWRARWRVLLDEPADAERFAALAQGMPGLARALTEPEREPVGPRTALHGFLQHTVDVLARDSAGKVLRRLTRAPRAPAEAWLSALGHVAWVQGDAATIAAFADREYRAWATAPVEAADTFRLCLRLSPPGGDPAAPLLVPRAEARDWRLDFLLQATDDPSLLVPAADIWRSTGTTARFLNRRFDSPQERFLAGLGRSARLFPPIEAGLRSPAPEHCPLNLEEASRFMREAGVLQADGIGVLVPGLANRLGVRLNLRSTPSGPNNAPSKLTREALVQYDWQLAVGDQTLTREELETLARLKAPLVQLRGQWVELRPEQIDGVLRFFKDRPRGELGLLDALGLALAPPEAGELPIVSVETDDPFTDLLETLRGGGASSHGPIGPIEGFTGQLRPYQAEGVRWLATLRRIGFGACLADDMGLGKAQPLDARVLTPDGWRCIGGLTVGDPVIGRDGQVHTVTGVYPQGERDIYRVTFNDGFGVECDGDHLWAVNTPVRNYRRAPFLVKPLREIACDLKDKAGNNKWFIPMVEPVAFPERLLPVDPYTLGALLGDGGISQARIYFAGEDETARRLVLPAGVEARPKPKRFTHDRGGEYHLATTGTRTFNPLIRQLKALGCMGCRAERKRVPPSYLVASVDQRLGLLQGLLDTDGYCAGEEAGKTVEFSTVSTGLADDVVELVQSLGGIARVATKRPTYTYQGARRVGQLSYRINITLPEQFTPFRLTRKVERYRAPAKYKPNRAIAAVDFVGRKPAVCIAVDAPDQLYITDHFVVTHNTVQTIAQLLAHDPGQAEPRPTLLICPTSVVGNWRREVARFAPGLRLLIHHGAARERAGFAELARQHDLVISSYALVARDEAILGEVEWDSVILDEAQNIKNPATKAAGAIRRLQAGWRAALTGTPVENRLAELWSLFHFLNPGYLGSAEAFQRHFARPIERAHDAEATARLKALVAPFILRRLKTDPTVISDLPAKQEFKVFCTLTREQATLYEAVLKDAFGEIEAAEGIQRRGAILGALTKLKQVCDHPALLLHDGSALEARSGKLARLTEMLEEVLAVDERALIFTQYAEMGRLLQAHLADTFGAEVLFLHGGTPAPQRDAMVARFQAEGAGPAAFVLSLKAGGTGLNLTRANHVFHFDRWWNPAVENQATDRAFRIGQRRDVQVHKFVCAGTFEEQLDTIIEEKLALAQSIVGAGERWITELSTNELRDLFRLRADAVAGG